MDGASLAHAKHPKSRESFCHTKHSRLDAYYYTIAHGYTYIYIYRCFTPDLPGAAFFAKTFQDTTPQELAKACSTYLNHSQPISNRQKHPKSTLLLLLLLVSLDYGQSAWNCEHNDFRAKTRRGQSIGSVPAAPSYQSTISSCSKTMQNGSISIKRIHRLIRFLQLFLLI